MIEKLHRKLLIILLLVGALGVASTYMRLSETDDELFHISCGMEWWQDGTYAKHPLNPPLARIASAMLPYWLNVDNRDRQYDAQESKKDTYLYRMLVSRLGMLPFYIFSCLLVYNWSKELFGIESALWSLALYILLSTVTGHAALATTDMTYTAMLLWAIFSTIKWLDNPTTKNSLIMGLSSGLMICSKFTSIAQFPSAMLLIIIARMLGNNSRKQPIMPFNREHLKTLLIFVLPIIFYVIVLIYRFYLDQFWRGIFDAQRLNNHGWGIWLYGPSNNKGLWYFFPVVFFFKTPLPFFVAFIAGIYRSGLDPKKLSPLLAAVGIMAISMTGHVNLGVRHVLPVYPFLAIIAGCGINFLWQQRGIKRLIACILVLWQLAGFISAYPEHIAYFNELAGDHPEQISLDSDYDWGQAVIMLNKAIEERHINEFYLCVRHDAVWGAHILLHADILACPKQSVSGWVAVGRAFRLLDKNNFTWLDGHEAVQRIGKTMDLYYFPPK